MIKERAHINLVFSNRQFNIFEARPFTESPNLVVFRVYTSKSYFISFIKLGFKLLNVVDTSNTRDYKRLSFSVVQCMCCTV